MKTSILPVATISNKKGVLKQEEYFCGNHIASNDKSNYIIFKANYFGYNPARINVGSVAINDTNEDLCLSPMYIVFSSKINNSYLKHYFRSHMFNQIVKSKISGSVRNTLSSDSLKEIPFIDYKNTNLSKIILLEQLDVLKQKCFKYIEYLKNKKIYFLNKIFIN